ncbi:hypothetical protein P3X46_013766 [Hevea brasiliensis]|uniref:Uncharacterized protein n=2 Tax=Hevea brasiliensis TaxID=3981 RepID=A0A6A6KZS0_HEVBR|nr:uncharacterized protein LOC110670415 isoform X2 [Hevea brasiliensis]KAF2294572.1 hypothetical protein GH714_012716 [Hevea brasiliensis]KAJ9175187.1 hypothetical protein P3X46_013766 [Hevea brasiliensis]
MAKAGIANTRMLILREARHVHNHFANLSTTRRHYYHYHHHHHLEESGNSIMEAKTEDGSCWVPHPRTGIYVPKGHERVMDDVPESAASFNQTYWLRNVDGVERPDPDVPSDHYLSKDFY